MPNTSTTGEAGSVLAGLALSHGTEAPTRGSMPDSVAATLREAILDGTLQPGSWLREAEVARELNVSRTPVRDAFRILAAESLVDITANQGAVVSPMTSDDVIELYVVREALEALATRLAARRPSKQCRDAFATLIPEMKRAAADKEIRELSQLNFQFHEIIREAAGNRYLMRSLSQVHNAARRFPDPTLGLPGRVDESIAEHFAIADAICQGDAETAAKLAAGHMRHLAELRIRMLLST
jgi:DNA-binding GntR family transcriptional regulator